jgi:hypothetical protein
MSAARDHLDNVARDVADALALRDPAAVPPLDYLTRLVDHAIGPASLHVTPGYFAEMHDDPATGAPWVDGSPEWMHDAPACRAYWTAAGEDAGNRGMYPERGPDTPEARAFDTTTAVGQLELACAVFDLVRWNLQDDGGEA